MKLGKGVGRLLVACLIVGSTSSARASDSLAAEALYKTARRLVAERSPDAASTMSKVFELDPDGPLADDASIESALLVGVARWPEDLGTVPRDDVRLARRYLERVTEGLPRADRAIEARFYLALQRLEPISGRDVSAARLDLLALTDSTMEGEWSSRARYTRAFMNEYEGEFDAASAAYQRLVIDAPHTPVAARSLAGLGRAALREGRLSEAASRFDDATRAGVPDLLSTAPLRELAVRAMLGTLPGDATESEIVAAGIGIRSIAGWVAFDDGGVAMADQRSGEIRRYRSDGSVSARWTLTDLQAVAAGPLGSLYAVAGESIYRLRAGLDAVETADLDDFGPVTALAVDGVGRLYLLDKRGTTVTTVEPGADEPEPGWAPFASKLAGLVWDRDRLLALESRGKRVVVLGRGGGARTLVEGIEKPAALAIDRAGRLAVVDGKAGVVSFFGSGGQSLGSWDARAARVLRPEAIAFACDGTLQIFDGANETWVRLP